MSQIINIRTKIIDKEMPLYGQEIIEEMDNILIDVH